MKGKHSTIEKNFTGKSVYDCQGAMNLFGYRDKNGNYLEEDSDFGSKTDYAVKQFQSDYDLGADGKMSSKGITWATIDKLNNNIKTVKVTAQNGLNVRTGRGMSYKIIKTLDYGTKHTATNSVNGWTYLHDAGGWVASQYIS